MTKLKGVSESREPAFLYRTRTKDLNEQFYVFFLLFETIFGDIFFSMKWNKKLQFI